MMKNQMYFDKKTVRKTLEVLRGKVLDNFISIRLPFVNIGKHVNDSC